MQRGGFSASSLRLGSRLEQVGQKSWGRARDVPNYALHQMMPFHQMPV